MLLELRIGNLALVEELCLRLEPGLTMLTGETGAGKSMIAGALSLLTGGRADQQIIRLGEDLAYVEAVFDLSDRPDDLQEAHRLGIRIEDDGILLLRRELRRNGRGRVLINGLVSSLALLEQIGTRLLSIQSQDQQRRLTLAHFAQEYLDRSLHLSDQREAFAERFGSYAAISEELADFQREMAFAREQLDVWRYQFDELDKAALDPQEETDLREKLALGRNLRAVCEAADKARNALAEDQPSVRDQLAAVSAALTRPAADSPRLAQILENLTSALELVNESATGLERFLDSLNMDPDSLDELEGRQALYQELQRKYDTDVAGLLARRETLCGRLERQADASDELVELTRRRQDLAEEAAAEGLRLRESRRQGAPQLADRVCELAARLGLPDLQLRFAIEPLRDDDGPLLIEGEPCRGTRNGCERIRLLARTNPGEAEGEVGQIASGGEKSRIFLALTALDEGDSGHPLMLFDEIDAGIGLDQAAAVAGLLRRLSAGRQVLCITHLPTVAARGNAHFKVTKTVADDRSRVEIRPVQGADRVHELARLLGEGKVADTAQESRLEYARQLLADSATG